MHMHRHTRPNAHAPHTRRTRAVHALRQRAQVLSLLMRFYEARGGVVAIDGHDVTSLDPAWLRSRLAFVQQEPVLFSDSIRANIAFAKPDASEEEIHRAAEAANVAAFAALDFDRTATTRSSASGACGSPGGRSSASPSRGPSS